MAKIHQVLTYFLEIETYNREFQYNIHHKFDVLKTNVLVLRDTLVYVELRQACDEVHTLLQIAWQDIGNLHCYSSVKSKPSVW